MAKYLRDGEPFSPSDFSSDFGFTGSTRGSREARNRAPADQTDDGTYVAAQAKGGRIKRAMGGPAIPGGIPGQGSPPPMGAMPTGSPGVAAQNPAQTLHGALSNATITMPVGDAARAAAGAVQLGHQIGHAQAMRGMTPRVARPPMPQQAPAMAEGGKFLKSAVKHPGALHRDLGVPEGEPIPAKKLTAATHSDDPQVRRRAVLARTMKGFRHHGEG